MAALPAAFTAQLQHARKVFEKSDEQRHDSLIQFYNSSQVYVECESKVDTTSEGEQDMTHVVSSVDCPTGRGTCVWVGRDDCKLIADELGYVGW